MYKRIGRGPANIFPPEDPWCLSPSFWLENYYLSVETPEDARLANEIRGKTDPHYLKWAVDRIVNWRNEWIPSQLYHLHGSRDRMFPLKRVKATHVVRGAGHFMVNNRAEEISTVLDKILNSP